MSHGTAAILIVNGGQDPAQGKWLKLCLDKIAAHTRDANHHIYVWNNNTGDTWVADAVAGLSNATLFQADPTASLAHPHAVPLQRLYERAVSDGATHIVALDSDAHPIRDGWLTGLIDALNDKTVLAGVWRDELAAGIEPYLHASCLCTTVDFIRQHHLRLDVIPDNTGKRSDTLSTFTDKANELGLGIHKLRRGNRNNIHHLISGIYGDTIYHHGAGSRPQIFFWGRSWTDQADRLNRQFRDTAASLLFGHYDKYIAWLRGRQDTVLILGMHRSGTSCLAGCLERSGLHLGDVNRSNPHNPRGNHELRPLVQFHESVLTSHGGSWSSPPPATSLKLSDNQKQTARAIVDQVLATRPCGLKEPRMLLLLDDWLKMIAPCRLIGTYRHPSTVARSLAKRDNMSESDAAAVWIRYNQELVRAHRTSPFPIVSFDIPDADEYVQTVAAAAVALGLQPNLTAIRAFVSDEYRQQPGTAPTVPASCRETYSYLESNRYRPGAFETGIVQLCGLMEQATTRGPAGPKNVVILGSGRSGTSALAGMLAKAGYYMGDNLWPARDMNPRGFFEDRDVNHINERLIAAALNRRYKWLPRRLRPSQPGEWQRWLARVPMNIRFRQRPDILDRIRKVTAHQPFCLKDPRFCYTLPAWRDALGDSVFVCVFRDPATTAESIVKACQTDPDMRGYPITFDEAIKVWTLMYRHVLAIHRHRGTWLFVQFDQILDGTAAQRLAAVTGANVDPSFVDATLHRTTTNRHIPSATRAIYRQLCALAETAP